jgi:hypothetical protein
MKETGVLWENQRSVVSHWQTLSHSTVVSGVPSMRGIWTHNFGGYLPRLHYYDHDGPFITRKESNRLNTRSTNISVVVNESRLGIVYSFHWCFWCFVFIGDIVNNFPLWPDNLAFQSFNFERTWWRLLHKHVERTTFDIFVFKNDL